MSRTVAVITALLVFIIAFLFLVPVVSYSMPAGTYSVPPSYVKYGSITYWALGTGGTWRYIGHGAEGYTQGYSVSVVSATASASSTSTVSYTCHIPGGPAGAYLRILSDSTLEPVTGALVTATHSPASCTPESTRTYTTNSTEWVPLDVTNDGHYNFTVSYSGHTYTFSAPLRPVSMTCTTLYVPSGRTNSTITEFKSTCP